MDAAPILSGLVSFAAYFGASIGLLALFGVLYAMVTPYRELALIADGNVAAACSLSGALLGFALPLASAISHSVGYGDMLLWGAVALLAQLLTFTVVRHIFPRLVADIPAGKTAKGIFLGLVSVVIGVLNAACITY
ncbi:MAG: DUF350 domain-containing protein [Thermodesulfobacteriota bacterium]